MSLSNTKKTSNSIKKSKYTTILTRPIAFHRVYATIAGSACAGLFLSQAIYWDSKTDDPEGWFYKTYEQWTSETALNRYELDKIRHHLTNLKILETQLKHSPAQLYYRINHEVLDSFLDAVKQGSFTSVRPKSKSSKKHSDISKPVEKQQAKSVCSPSTNLFDDSLQSESVCSPSTNLFDDDLQPSSSTVSNPNCSPSTNSIYIETEITSEITTHNAPPNKSAPPTQECVCEESGKLDQPNQPNQEEELIPESLASLSNQSESSVQPDKPSCRPSIAAGSFDKVEQPNNIQPPRPISDLYKSARDVEELIEAWITDPTAFADDFVPVVVREKIKWNCWVLPWHSNTRKLNTRYQNFNPLVVDLIAEELASKSSCTKEEKITHAISVMSNWEKNKGGWTNLMQRYRQALEKQQNHTQSTSPHSQPKPKQNISLAQALAQDEQRRQQEQAKQNLTVPPPPPSTDEIKEKLQAMANNKKSRSSSWLSAASLNEIETQLKQALGA